MNPPIIALSPPSLSVSMAGFEPRKTDISVRLVPIIIGTSADMAGASGSKGWRGSSLPSTLGRHWPSPELAFAAARCRSAIGTSWILSMSAGERLSSASSRRPFSAASSGPSVRSWDPLWTTARWKRPLAGS